MVLTASPSPSSLRSSQNAPYPKKEGSKIPQIEHSDWIRRAHLAESKRDQKEVQDMFWNSVMTKTDKNEDRKGENQGMDDQTKRSPPRSYVDDLEAERRRYMNNRKRGRGRGKRKESEESRASGSRKVEVYTPKGYRGETKDRGKGKEKMTAFPAGEDITLESFPDFEEGQIFPSIWAGTTTQGLPGGIKHPTAEEFYAAEQKYGQNTKGKRHDTPLRMPNPEEYSGVQLKYGERFEGEIDTTPPSTPHPCNSFQREPSYRKKAVEQVYSGRAPQPTILRRRHTNCADSLYCGCQGRERSFLVDPSENTPVPMPDDTIGQAFTTDERVQQRLVPESDEHSWDIDFERILNSDCFDPAMIERVGRQMDAANLTDEQKGIKGRFIDAIRLNLIRSSSYPVAPSVWFERFKEALGLQEEADAQAPLFTHESSSGESLYSRLHEDSTMTHEGVETRRYGQEGGDEDDYVGVEYEDRDEEEHEDHRGRHECEHGRLPSGLPTTSERPLLTPIRLSRPVSTESQIKLLKGTSQVQGKLIMYLHAEVDSERTRSEDLAYLVTVLDSQIAEQVSVLDSCNSYIKGLREENRDLKSALDFGNEKIINGCFKRSLELLWLLEELQKRKQTWNRWRRALLLVTNGNGNGNSNSNGNRNGNGNGNGAVKGKNLSKKIEPCQAFTVGRPPPGPDWEVPRDANGKPVQFGPSTSPPPLSGIRSKREKKERQKEEKERKAKERKEKKEEKMRNGNANGNSTGHSSSDSKSSLSKKEIEALVEVAKQNLWTLEEDIEDMKARTDHLDTQHKANCKYLPREQRAKSPRGSSRDA